MSTTGNPDLAGAYEGERIFLIGNGPSLAETPLDALEDEYTMAMNKIDLIYDAVDWRPDFYVCTHRLKSLSSNLRRSIQVHDDIDSTHSFLDADLRKLASTPAADVTYLNVNYMQDFQRENPMNTDTRTVRAVDRSWLEKYWSYDITEVVWAFHTMYVAAQLSLWMGFNEIYFIGTDLGHGDPVHMPMKNGIDPMSYKGEKLNYFKAAIEQKKLFSAIVNGVTVKLLLYIDTIGGIHWVLGPDDNHFASSYQGQTIYRNPDAELERSHVVIRRICESAGVRVWNATLGGELEVYPRVDFNQVLHR